VDQVAEYWTSRHGQLLRDSNDPAVATCIDCHPAHQIRPPDDPESTVHPANVVATCGRCHADAARMAARDIPTNQVAEYSSSVHGRLLLEEGDLSAPVCNDCHGNHGAAPPGLASVRNVCGQCHSVMADYFDQSAHEQIFEEANLPGCALCHDHHAIQSVEDATLVERSEDVCATCHVPPDTLGLEFQRIAAVLDTLTEAEEASRAVLEEAENAGMEVSQAFFELDDVRNAQTRAHSAIHTFRVEAVRDEVAAGLAITAQVEERGYEALEEHGIRRVGLGVFAAIALMLILGIALKIREYEDRAEDMVAQVEAFYRQALGGSRDRRQPTAQQVQLAASALMLEVCHADGALTSVEQSYMAALARKRFGLQAEEAAQLIRLAERERGLPGQLDRITTMIAEHFTLERKWVLLDELWALVSVDGEASPEEVEFMERLTHLIGVGLADSAAARARGAAAASMADHEAEETT
jgi:predicted CXXCH cytochrome family protein